MLTDIDEASVRLIVLWWLLEVSRLEQGNITFEKTNFNIIEVTEKLLTLYKQKQVKNISLEIVKPENHYQKFLLMNQR